MTAAECETLVRDYLTAIESGAPFETLARFFTEDVEQVEYPNRLVPDGATRDLAAMREGSRKGREVLTGQSYDIRAVTCAPPRVAVEVVWTGTLAVPIGSLTPGDAMRAHFCMVLELENGRIRRQRNYDCFDPF